MILIDGDKSTIKSDKEILKEAMTNKTPREQAIEKIATEICSCCRDMQEDCEATMPCPVAMSHAEKALAELIFLGYVQLAEDQSLPDIPTIPSWLTPAKYNTGCYQTQQDMLTTDKNGCVWVKVKKELK